MLDNSAKYYDQRTLYSLYALETKYKCEEIDRRLEANIAALKNMLTGEEQRLLLLRIIDDKDLFRAKATDYYYAKGFRRALVLIAESFCGED